MIHHERTHLKHLPLYLIDISISLLRNVTVYHLAKVYLKQCLSFDLVSLNKQSTNKIMSSNHTENVQNRNMEDKERTLLDKFLGAIIKTLFVVGSSALVLDSVRNSLTWYLGKFWGDAGSAWQEIWTNILALVITFHPNFNRSIWSKHVS